MLEKGFAGPDLSRDEETTCEAMLGEGEARLTVMPTHHINSLGDLIGFRFDCAPYLPGSSLPLVRTMFHGHTLVECQAKESDILRLMSHPEENQQCMKRFLQDVEAECVPATLDCVPENASALTSSGQVHAQGLRSVDSRRWTPEVPERIGIYHAYIRSYNRDARTHKLFISVTGGLSRASDAFCNLVIDVGRHWTALEVCESEEAWWLRKGCQRARCRLVKQLADRFSLGVTHIQDIQSYDPAAQVAIATSETVEHDIARMGTQVAVYSACADTTRNMNGVVCNMHPSEGVWIFRGAARGGCFGSMFGDYKTCGVFPTSAPKVARQQSILVQDSPHVVRLHSPVGRDPYMCFDEAYFRILERMQWNRDNGHVELIPIVVGLQ